MSFNVTILVLCQAYYCIPEFSFYSFKGRQRDTVPKKLMTDVRINGSTRFLFFSLILPQ